MSFTLYIHKVSDHLFYEKKNHINILHLVNDVIGAIEIRNKTDYLSVIKPEPLTLNNWNCKIEIKMQLTNSIDAT